MSSGDDLPSQVAKGALSSEDGGPDEDQSKPKSPKRRIITRTDTMATAKTSSSTATVTISLLPKLLHTTKLLLGSHSFYFSYDFDITRQLGRSLPQGGDIPLYKIVDPLYHWNRHLSSEFADAGQHAFVLPLMQGFVGQRAFTVNTEPSKGVIADVKEDVGEVIELQDNASVSQKSDVAAKTRDFLVTLISRRSIMRPGLRYLRRGVDEEGHAANCVETEQILCDPSWTAIHSFTQLRASMPLFFSQSPYSFKPAPMLQHSLEANQAAFKRHFTDIVKRYGDIQVASLIDKHGTEAKIGNEFEKHINILNEHNSANGKMIRFEWFDFHHACRGMKFENVRLLTESLSRVVKNYGHTVEIDGEIKQTQSGILRVNCMDCLDRTNVVESAFASNALQEQLAEEGVTLDMEADVSTRWYNVLWAENGDAVSKQYSSTAALKGDYTRTRKRDYRGALNDFGLTLTRYYNNIVNDFFSQAAIDFLIGNVSDDVFEEFEGNLSLIHRRYSANNSKKST